MSVSVTTPAHAGRERAATWGFTHAWTLAVWAAMAFWTLALFAVARGSYLGFREGRFDLGNMVQAIWSTAHGSPLEVTHGATGEQVVRLAAHADPFLVLLTPLWLVWQSPLVLALAQVAAVALGALPVFWLARRHLGSERLAALLALAYLAYPWLAVSAVAAIHPVTFAIPLLLFCIWFLDSGRLGPFALCAVLAASTGELMGLPFLGLGVWYALACSRRAAGAAIAAAGLGWTVLAVYVVVPAFAGDESMYFGFYDHLGGSPQGVVRTLVTDPGAVVGALVEGHDVAYLVWLAVPLLGVFLLSPGLAAAGLPQLLANVLSGFRSMSDPRYHSVAAVLPFLFGATVLGLRKLTPERRTLASASIAVVSLTLAAVVGPWPRLVGATPLGGRDALPPERVEALRDAVALVPENVPVTTSNSAGAHLAARRTVYSVPLVRDAEWVLVDLGDPWVVTRDSPILTNRPGRVRGLARRLASDPAWTRVFDREGVLLFRRAPSR